MGRKYHFLLVFLVPALYLPAQPVDYLIPGEIYNQSFNGLPASGSYSLSGKGPFNLNGSPFNASDCTGWQIWMHTGSNANANFAVSTGSSTGNAVYSVGPAGSSDRALGSLSSGTAKYAFGMVITNASGQFLNRCTLTFTVEQWRKGGSGNRNVWTFHYKTGHFSTIDQVETLQAAALNMESLHFTTGGAALNGNLPENSQRVTYTIEDIVWKPGEQLLLRWDDADETGNDDVCAIDDFSFSASLVSAVPFVITQPAGAITPHSALLAAIVDDNHGDTKAWFVIDTTNEFLQPDSVPAFPSIISAGTGPVPATAALANLHTGKTYYYFISGENIHGVSTGDTLSFTPQATKPTVLIEQDVVLSGKTATVTAVLQATGGLPIVEAGLRYSLNEDFSSATSIKVDDISQMVVALTGLPAGIPLFVQAYALNEIGIAYSETITFTIPPDLTPPTLTRIGLPLPRTYRAGDSLTFVFYFDEPVIISGTASSLTFSITVGNKSRSVQYHSGEGTDSLLFRYVIEPGETDKDGIRIATPLGFLHATVTDSAGNQAILSLPLPSTASILIDATLPVISNIKTPAAADYRTGNYLDFIINFSKNVVVKGADISLYLPVIIGDQVRNAWYVSGAGSSAWLFRYEVDSSDMDKDGIKLGSTLIGSDVLSDEAGNPLVPTLNNIGALSKVLVNMPTVAVTGATVPPEGWYKSGDTLIFLLHTNESVFVNIDNGLPSVRFTCGSTQKQAVYTAGSGSSTLQFMYVIREGDLDTNGIALNTSLAFNNSSIKDSRGNNMPATLNNLPSTADVCIDAVPPGIKSVFTPPKGLYKPGDTLQYQVVFTEEIIVNIIDTPYILLEVGNQQRQVVYNSQLNPTTLLFAYVVQDGDADRNGVFVDSVITSSPLCITDIAGNVYRRQLKNVAAQSGIHLDGTAPNFVYSNDTAFVCSSESIELQQHLEVTNIESNETITWTLVPNNPGTLSAQELIITTSKKSAIPPTLLYSPQPGYQGVDSIICIVSDGVNSSRKTLYVQTLSSITNNQISSAQLVCVNTAPFPLEGTLPTGGNGQWRFMWEQSVANDSTRFTTAPGLNNEQGYAPGKIQSNTWFRRKVMSGNCTSISDAVKITVQKNGFWLGKTGTDWHDANNWCMNVVPDIETDVLITANNTYPPLITTAAYCRNLTLAPETSLTLRGSLQLRGNMDASAQSIDATEGQLIMQGNQLQILDAGMLKYPAVKDLLIYNTTGVMIQRALSVQNLLALSDKVKLFTNDSLILLPKARMAPSGVGAAIIGNVHLQQRIPIKAGNWQLLGNPFSHSIGLSMIADSIDSYGNNDAASGSKETSEPTLYYYSATSHDPYDIDGFAKGWHPFTQVGAGHADNQWASHGAIRFLPIKEGNPVADTVISMRLTGQITTGELELNLDGAADSSFHVVANPYVAWIDLGRVAFGTGIAPCYWLWDPTLANTGGYRCFPAGTSHLIPPLGVFIVKAINNIDNNILFTEAVKINGIPNDHDAASMITYTEPFIALELNTDSGAADQLLIREVTGSWAGPDITDAGKIGNPAYNLYSLSREALPLSIDTRKLDNAAVIPIAVYATNKGRYALRVAASRLSESSLLQLHDRYLQQWMPLKADSSYFFTITEDTPSYGNNRFEIRAFQPAPDTALSTSLVVNTWPVPARSILHINFYNREKASTYIDLISLNGVIQKSVSAGTTNQGTVYLPVADLPPGIYILHVRGGTQVVVKKIVVN